MRIFVLIVFLIGVFHQAKSAPQCTAKQGVGTVNPTVTTNQACFEACAADPLCYQYTFENGGCSYQIVSLDAMNTVDNVDTYAYVYCNCTKVCKAAKNQGRLDTLATTNQACFQACSDNPRCFLYDYYQGGCKLYGADGDAVDTVTNQNTQAFVYCTCDTSVADTTQNPSTTTAATTTTAAVIELGCPASTGLQNTSPVAKSEQECFELCASNPKCHIYQYSGGCTHQVSNEEPHDSTALGAWAYVHCRCTKQCKALKSWTRVNVNENTTLGCFKACFANPRCILVSFDGEEGTCANMVATGDVVTSTVNNQAYVYCEACDETTTTATTPTTITTKTTTTKITTTTSTTSTSTTQAPAQRYYDCHSCTSGCSSKKQNYQCPANGKIKTGTNTRFARCKGPCMSTVNKTLFGSDVVRGCSDGKFPGLRIPANGCLTHKNGVTCFCTGDRCNTRNMVQEQSRMGYGWWLWRGHH